MDIKKRWERDERPCLSFARLNLDDEHEVARFMYKLFVDLEPEMPFLLEFNADIDPEDVYYGFFDSPAERMGTLMWEALLGRPLRDPPCLDITINFESMKSFCKENAYKLKVIQVRLVEVLEDHILRKGSKDRTGAWKIDRWLLNDDEREFVNRQLRKVHPQIVAIPSPSTSEFSEFLGYHKWEEVFLVPEDFEAALYADLAEFFRSDGDIDTCSLCGLFIEPSRQQQARLKKGEPIYHPNCHSMKRKQDYKKYREERKKSDPEFMKKERQRAKKYYQEVIKGE